MKQKKLNVEEPHLVDLRVSETHSAQKTKTILKSFGNVISQHTSLWSTGIDYARHSSTKSEVLWCLNTATLLSSSYKKLV